MRPSFDSVVATLRSTIDRQVATTRAGRALVAHDPALVENLVRNIVGNLAYAVDAMIDEACEGAS